MSDVEPGRNITLRVANLDGAHAVVCSATGRVLAGPFTTNAQAWRACDSIALEPINKHEATAQWAFQQDVARG